MSHAPAARALNLQRADNAPRPASPGAYLRESERPLPALVFLLPVIILYEVGIRRWGIDQRIIAFNLIQHFFGWFGASGRYLPALSVVGILLAWHIARNDPWRFKGSVPLKMLLESCCLAVPLLTVSAALARYLPLLSLHVDANTPAMGIMSLGAGVYEELVFRLIGMTVLHVLLFDWMKLPARTSAVLMVLISAVAFSLYHYLGYEHFTLRTFVFRVLAGIYFGTVFLLRGFGITAGSHAAYDVTTVLWRVLAS